MQAKESHLMPLLEGTKKYLVPLFQRQYSWGKKEWSALWDDINAVLPTSHSHFFGTIVTYQETTAPHQISTYVIIDGQQRLTSIFIIMIGIYHIAKIHGNTQLADQIYNTILTNPYSSDDDKWKLVPSETNKNDFYSLINRSTINDSGINKAYSYFYKQLSNSKEPLINYFNVLKSQLIVVDIVLNNDDNPHMIFESLNAKGQPLTQADLIRNYILMKIPTAEQKKVYEAYWVPVEKAMNENITEFIRHYLILKQRKFIRQSDVYIEVKNDPKPVIDLLTDMLWYSKIYFSFLDPNAEGDTEVRKRLTALQTFNSTTVYPILLNLVDAWKTNKLSKTNLINVLKKIEVFFLRRNICQSSTNILNNLFPSIISDQISDETFENYNNFLTTVLGKRIPNDQIITTNIKESVFYGNSHIRQLTRFIFTSIERSYNHQEIINLDTLSIEHIMPQTLNADWISDLGPDYESIHKEYLHSLGNLTLTGYNSTLSNNNYTKKKLELANSNLELNKIFSKFETWDETAIDQRTDILSEKILELWPDFSKRETPKTDGITFTTPDRLHICGIEFDVSTWRQVLKITFDEVYKRDPSALDKYSQKFPQTVNKNPEVLLTPQPTVGGYYIDINLSAKSIVRICRKLINLSTLDQSDWDFESS